MHPVPLDLGLDLKDVVAIGDVENGFTRGLLVRTILGQVFDVYWKWLDE